jgi:hypothetical protein
MLTTTGNPTFGLNSPRPFLSASKIAAAAIAFYLLRNGFALLCFSCYDLVTILTLIPGERTLFSENSGVTTFDLVFNERGVAYLRRILIESSICFMRPSVSWIFDS